ncbi:MAG: hypothetical protein WAM66_10880 [Acidobacteriaceae bacterium]
MKVVAALIGFLLAGAAFAQTPSSPVNRAHVSFTVERPQLEPTDYSLEIYEDGSGSYRASYTASANGDSAPEPVARAIHIHNPLLSELFREARGHHYFAFNCEERHDRVAFTGKKTLAYSGPDGAGSCTFNYSREQWVNQLADDLEAVGYTLEIGVKLKQEQRYQRLSLDDELASLENATQNHEAIEIENIAPELESIVGDDAVMKRARERAYKLLSEAGGVHRASRE